MALDNRDRRSAALLFDLPVGRPLPNPNGAVAAADRAHVAMKYGGLFSEDTGGTGERQGYPERRGLQWLWARW